MLHNNTDSPFKYYDLREMKQYAKLKVPQGIIIPTTDDGAWECYPKFRWVYNRIDVALSQGIVCAPVGVTPKKYPVFLKPITNLYGGGFCARTAHSAEEYQKYEHLSGYFWMECLEGEHLSHDIIMSNGDISATFTFRGHSLGKGMFDFWETIEGNDAIHYVKKWAIKHLHGFTGCVNIETLGGRIIECHLRMGDIDGFGNLELMQSIVDVHAHKKWSFSDKIPKFYEFALWGNKGVQYKIDRAIVNEIGKNLTFCHIDPSEFYVYNPIGGVRVAILGDYDKEKCIKTRQLFYEKFTPKPRKPKTEY